MIGNCSSRALYKELHYVYQHSLTTAAVLTRGGVYGRLDMNLTHSVLVINRTEESDPH